MIRHGSVPSVACLRAIPSEPPHYFARQEVDRQVADWLEPAAAAALALVGSDRLHASSSTCQFFGVGTSTSAAAAARAAQHRFADGVLWVQVGPAPSIPHLHRKLAQSIGMEDCLAGSACAIRELRRMFRSRHLLLVLDDVHEPEHAAALDIVGAPSRTVLTCHDARVLAGVNAVPVPVPPLARDQARLALSRYADAPIEELDALETRALDAVVAHCERLPLMLQMAGALAKAATFADALQRIERARGQSPHVRAQLSSLPALPVFEAAYQALKKRQRARYRDLGVLPDDEPISEPVLATLWQRDLAYVHGLLEFLATRALIARTGDGRFHMHDSQRWYARARDDDPPSRHDRLLRALVNKTQEPESGAGQAMADSMEGCSAYLVRRAAYHSIHAHQFHEIRRLLCDPVWLTHTLRSVGPSALAEEFDRALALVGPDPELSAARATIRAAEDGPAEQPEYLAQRIAALLLPPDHIRMDGE